MAKGLLVLETAWNEPREILRPSQSVLPFLQGLAGALDDRVVCRAFNAAEDLTLLLRAFVQNPGRLRYCYVAAHGSRGRIYGAQQGINLETILRACRGSRGKGYIFGSCGFVNEATAARFLRETGARFIAGYSGGDVPWMETTIIDLLFLTYLIGGKVRRQEKDGRVEIVKNRKGDILLTRSPDPLTLGRWVYEDLPLARLMGFNVYSLSRAGRRTARLISSLAGTAAS